MKKIYLIFAIFMVAMTSWADQIPTETDENGNVWYLVSNADEFTTAISTKDASGNYNANVRLTADIDLQNVSTARGTGNVNLYEIVFKGKISGENANGEDFCFTHSNNPLFQKTMNATISHVVFNACSIHTTVEGRTQIGFLASKSSFCNLSNITVRKSYIDYGSVYVAAVTGALVGYSYTDRIENCTVESSCSVCGRAFTSYNVPQKEGLDTWDNGTTWAVCVGGLVGWAYGTTFTLCSNGANLDAQVYNYDGDTDETDSSGTLYYENADAGGIVGLLENGSIDRCLNTGSIDGKRKDGGIVGQGNNSTITRCVNIGAVGKEEENSAYYFAGGILGYTNDKITSVSYCLNFGYVRNGYDGKNGPIIGYSNNLKAPSDGDNNYYHCYFSDKLKDSNSSEWSKILTGQYTCEKTDGDGTAYLYQSIDNDYGEVTLPTPIPSYGKVYSNYLCGDGTTIYSNRFKSTGTHTSVDEDHTGTCDICGDWVKPADDYALVKTPVELNDIARLVNKGKNYAGVTINICNDIDMEGYRFTPIGNETYPFKGSVSGSLSRIKNLEIEGTDVKGTGLFGYVSDCDIQGIIIDKSCCVYQPNDKLGTAGLIGCVATPNDGSDHIIYIYDCGNEANIRSNGAVVGGIIGNVILDGYNNNLRLTIGNCYNTGNIENGAYSDCGTIVGFAKNTTIDNTWNSGSILQYTTRDNVTYPFAGTYGNNGCTVTDCYDVNGVQPGVTKVTSDDIRFGILCHNLNANQDTNDVFYFGWKQDLSSDETPELMKEGRSDPYYTNTMKNQWGTLVLPFDIDYDAQNTNYNLYYLSDASSYALTFTEYADNTTIAAGTPMVVKKLSGDAIEIAPASNSNSTFSTTIQPSTTYTDWTMKGTYENVTGKTGVFFIAQDKFWYAAEEITIAPFRAWIETTSNAAKSFSIVEDDETDGISLIPTLFQCEGVSKYLENGKVVIVKNGKKFNINGQEIK